MIHILWMQIKEGIAIVVNVLNIWQETVGVEELQVEEGLNMGMKETI